MNYSDHPTWSPGLTEVKCKMWARMWAHKVPAPDNITNVSGAAVAHTGFDPLFWLTQMGGHIQNLDVHLQQLQSMFCTSETHKNTYTWYLYTHVLYETGSSYRFITKNVKEKKTTNPT